MSGKKILVADDSLASRELIREVLEMSSYEVIEAADGEEAVCQARDAAPDLLLVDIHMPRLDGFGVLRKLREEPRFAEVCIIALTASAMQGDRERALDAGFNGYITKPVEIAELRRAILRFL
jgi:two-component system cell cycle response regulator DivK